MPWDPFTYRGALGILGADDQESLHRLDRILGGLILGAGAAALVPSLGVLAPVFGWVDQKCEGLGIARSLLNRTAKRAARTSGATRLQLVAAAHSAIVGAAFFENFQEYVGHDDKELRLTADDKLRQLVMASPREDKSVIAALYDAPVPMPSAIRGYHENLSHLYAFYEPMAERTIAFLDGLRAWSDPGRWQRRREVEPGLFAVEATKRYEGLFAEVAATVPEFLIWSTLGEHGATRSALRDMRDDNLELHQVELNALYRVEHLLRKIAGPQPEEPRPLPDTRLDLHAANRTVLGRRIVRGESLRYVEGLTFPTVEEIYINPAFRAADFEGLEDDRPADDRFWADKHTNIDLDQFLAGHLVSDIAVRRPTLVLGHPGSGKSMLTQVLAARMPPETHTVIRVSLRNVDGRAPLHDQIGQALRDVTHGRVDWPALVRDSADSILVVLLDGFDELLQASGESQVSYLRDVAEFQRQEYGHGRPVVVFVTTRTVVAERARIPQGSVMLRLEPFTPGDIKTWLDVWNRVNYRYAAGGRLNEVEPADVLRYPTLAEQPLLLLMLTLYLSDPKSQAIGADVSITVLYQRLLENFAHRELERAQLLTDDAPGRVAVLIRRRLWELSVAAFGMFNRGSQYVTDEELGSDLSALVPGHHDVATGHVRRSALAHDVIGGFFFVHTSELDARHADARRSYEFLHATFGEFLLVNALLPRIADSVSDDVDEGGTEARDAKLYALLSHQTLVLRRSTLGFVQELFAQLPPAEQDRVQLALRVLLHGMFERDVAADLKGYRPLPTHHVRGLAAYSANLVLLLLTFRSRARSAIPLTDLCPAGCADPGRWWNSLLHLWLSGLDDANTSAIAEFIRRDPADGGLRAVMPGDAARPGSTHSGDLRTLFA